jgi:hypothetical protein
MPLGGHSIGLWSSPRVSREISSAKYVGSLVILFRDSERTYAQTETAEDAACKGTAYLQIGHGAGLTGEFLQLVATNVQYFQ